MFAGTFYIKVDRVFQEPALTPEEKLVRIARYLIEDNLCQLEEVAKITGLPLKTVDEVDSSLCAKGWLQ